jgi:predicted dehydrogenase
MINYRVNAGYIPLSSWLHGAEGGGRNIGEACHFYDLFVSIVNAAAQSIGARALHPKSRHYTARDNFSATIGFADGSVATLMYTALGSADFPKESFDVFVDGRVYSVSDFKLLSVAGAQDPKIASPQPEKGHRQELIAFAEAARHGGAWPIPLWQQIEAMRIAFEVERQICPAGAGDLDFGASQTS